MSKETTLENIRTALIDQREDAVARAVKEGLDGGIDPVDIMNEGLAPALMEIGEAFSKEEMYLPELIFAAEIAMTVVEELEKTLGSGAGDMEKRGRVVFVTVEGDVHDIGKKLVSMLMRSFGYEVIDGGVDVPNAKVIDLVKKEKPDIVALSALLTTTMPAMIEFIEMAEEAGIRDQIKVMVGGAPVSRNWAMKIGADGYSEDAATAIIEADKLMGLTS